ncbi:MAG: hypothetical protein QJR00_06415 [Bacillota bacterium]|nr:hypothetical protein [Bacillota bacterium]
MAEEGRWQVAVDLGTSQAVALVGRGAERGRATVPSHGLQKGRVEDQEAALKTVQRAVERALVPFVLGLRQGSLRPRDWQSMEVQVAVSCPEGETLGPFPLVPAPVVAVEEVQGRLGEKESFVLADFGEGSLDLAAVHLGEMLGWASLPFGSNYITADIAFGLALSLPEGEGKKRRYGQGGEDTPLLREIVEARMEEILLAALPHLRQLMAGRGMAVALWTGEGSRLAGLMERAEAVWGLASRRIPLEEGVTLPALGLFRRMGGPYGGRDQGPAKKEGRKRRFFTWLSDLL